MAKKGKTITTYKGFDKDLKCRGFQYEVGKEYELPKGESVSVCSNGFHAFESPLEVLDYYFMDGSANLLRFCEVEQSGEFSKEVDSTKVASSKIKIKKEITFADLIELGVEWLKEKTFNDMEDDSAQIYSSSHRTQIGSCDDCVQISSCDDSAQIALSGECTKIGLSGNFAKIGSSGIDARISSSGYSTKIASSGNYAQIASSGNYARICSLGDYAYIASSCNFVQISSSGNYAQISSSGNYTQINSTGEDSVIMCAGRNSEVKAKKGSWITLTEWYIDEMRPKCVKTEYVDGERIKEDTWYKLFNGKFVELNY